MLRLSFRILPLFAAVVGLAMALGAYMNYSGVRGAYLELITSRMQLVADEVGTVVEAAVSVGIAASEQVTLPDLLSRQAQADGLILSIDVVEPSGAILFSSDLDRPAGAIMEAGAQAAVIDRAIVNDFGVTVARVQVRYDTRPQDSAVAVFGQQVLTDAVPTSVLAILAGSLAAFLILSLLHLQARRATHPGGKDVVMQAGEEIAHIAPEPQASGSSASQAQTSEATTPESTPPRPRASEGRPLEEGGRAT